MQCAALGQQSESDLLDFVILYRLGSTTKQALEETDQFPSGNKPFPFESTTGTPDHGEDNCGTLLNWSNNSLPKGDEKKCECELVRSSCCLRQALKTALVGGHASRCTVHVTFGPLAVSV
jgi:hypothetical protein